MVILLLLSIFTILLLQFIYLRFYKPKKQMKIYAQRFQRAGFKPYILPYSPFGLPATQVFIKDTIAHQDCLYFHKKDLQGYDVLVSNIGKQPFLRLLHPDLIQQMCVHQRQWCYEKDKMAMSFVERIIGKGLITSQGNTWKIKRKLMNSVFNFDFISKMTDKITQKTVAAMQMYEQKSKNTNNELTNNTFQIKVFEFTMKIFSNVIFEGFLGGQLKNQKINGIDVAQFFIKIVDDVLLQFTDPLPWILGVGFLDAGIRSKDRELNNRISLFNSWARDFIQKRSQIEKKRREQQKNSYMPTDIMSSVFWENLKSQGNIYAQKQILDEFKTFFLAGTDSTAHFLQAIIFYVFKNPHIEKQLRQQLKQLKQDFNYEDIKHIKILDAIQKQVIRLVGPDNAIAPRTVVKDHILKGVNIERGTGIHEASITTHYSQLYYKQPEQFRPERWLNGQCDNLHPYAHVGFHGGPRGCLGKSLALLQAKVALICIIQRYQKIEVLKDKIDLQLRLLMGAKQFEIKAYRS